MRHVAFTVGLAAVLASGAAIAQTGNQETQQPPGPPPGLAVPPPQPGAGQHDHTVPEQVAPGAGLAPRGTVGSSGVIHPPAQVDPGITRTPPGTAGQSYKMQVVPPPGAPGGNPQVVPK